jgi:hypothetical protein
MGNISRPDSRHLGRAVDINLYYKVWQALELYGPMSASAVGKIAGASKAQVERIMDSLSEHYIPVYEEPRGGILWYGALRRYPVERFNEMMFFEEEGKNEAGREKSEGLVCGDGSQSNTC